MQRAVRKLRKSQALARVALVSRYLRNWDPLGIAALAPEDEYDAYAPQLVNLIAEGANDWRVAQHLSQVQSEQLGTVPTPTENLKVAREIIEALKLLPR